MNEEGTWEPHAPCSMPQDHARVAKFCRAVEPRRVRLNLPARPAPNFRDGPKIQLCAVLAPGWWRTPASLGGGFFNHGLPYDTNTSTHNAAGQWPRLCLVWSSRSLPKVQAKKTALHSSGCPSQQRASSRTNGRGTAGRWELRLLGTRHLMSSAACTVLCKGQFESLRLGLCH